MNVNVRGAIPVETVTAAAGGLFSLGGPPFLSQVGVLWEDLITCLSGLSERIESAHRNGTAVFLIDSNTVFAYTLIESKI